MLNIFWCYFNLCLNLLLKFISCFCLINFFDIFERLLIKNEFLFFCFKFFINIFIIFFFLY